MTNRKLASLCVSGAPARVVGNADFGDAVCAASPLYCDFLSAACGASATGDLHVSGASRRRPLGRLEEPNPGPRPHPAGIADEAETGRNHDARLQAARHHHTVCRPQHPRRHCHWPQHAASPASGVHPLPQHRDAGAEARRLRGMGWRAFVSKRQASPYRSAGSCDCVKIKDGVVAKSANQDRWKAFQ